MRVTVARGGV